MDFNQTSHPDCVYSDNPYHECASACLERIAQGHVKQKTTKKQTSRLLSFSGSFGRKKKDSQSQPNSPVPVRTTQNSGGDFISNGKSQMVHHSVASSVEVNKKTVSDTNKASSSSSAGGPSKAVLTKPEKQEENENIIEASRTTTLTNSLDFLKPDEKERSDEDDDDDEENINEIGVELDIESVMSDTLVSVGKYRVRSNSSTILSSILEKHGDIAKNCKLESVSMRSRYLECLCSLMLELRSTPVGQLTNVKVKEMLAVIKDLESVNIEMAWLRYVLEEFARTKEDVETEKLRYEGIVKAKREELATQEEGLVRLEKEVAKERLRIEETRAIIVEMEKMEFKVEKFKGKTFIDELL